MPNAPRDVALNALFLDPGVSGGPESYLRGLVPALAREYPDVRFTVLTTRRGAAALLRDGWGEFSVVEAFPADEGNRIERTVSEQMLLPARARRHRWDLVHSLASVAPVWLGIPSVVTVHDVTFLRIRTFGRITTFGMRQIVSRAARRADALLVGSAAARDEICGVLGIDPWRFSVVPHGAGRVASTAPAPADEVRRRYGVQSGRVLLTVAAIRPHKNQELLVRALEHLPEDVIALCVGHDEGYAGHLRQVAEELRVSRRLRLPGYTPDSDLEALWQVADCAVFPTLGEGFGLPVLEAMDRGVPVACSDLSVLREVGGDAPYYFDPHDPVVAARAIELALNERRPSEAGRRRATAFSWEAAAHGTFEAYERALHEQCTSA